MKNLASIILVFVFTATSFASEQSLHSNYINEIEKGMNELVLGQPEAVEAFIDLEKATIFSGGERQAPELIFLLGLPGTGKDTLVESYVKTKHRIKYGNTNRNILADHVFNVPKLLTEHDMMILTGSSPGLVDSDKMPPLINWLVKHSGGRYYIDTKRGRGGDEEKSVRENPNWKPGTVMPGYFAPEDAVLFVNELHDWKKELKNLFLKEALEKGKFVIANAKDGAHEIFVPINIILASNDGIGLIADRDSKGRPVGKPLTEVQLMNRWQRAIENPSNIKKQIKDISEELLSRLSNSRVKLLRPMTQTNLIKIIKLKLNSLSQFFTRNKEQNQKAQSAPVPVHRDPREVTQEFMVLMDHDYEEAFFRDPIHKKDIGEMIRKEIDEGRIIPERDQVLHLQLKSTFAGGTVSKKSPYYLVIPATALIIDALIDQDRAEAMTFEEFERRADPNSLNFKDKKDKPIVPETKFPSFELKPSESLVEFLSIYDQTAEDGGRLIDDKVRSMVLKTIQDAYFAHLLKINEGDVLHLDIQKNQDGTYNLVVNGQSLKIQYTEKTRHLELLSDQRIEQIVKMEGEINARVKGVSHIAKRITKSLLASANTQIPRDERLSEKKADLFVFLGVSSTGKTELAKAMNAAYYKTQEPVKVIDFSNVQTYNDVRKKILGEWDPSRNEAIPSDFMQTWDRHQGDFMIVFDEISNANPEVLRGLYDILREPLVQTFSDGKPRAMGQVKIIMTGNAGEEWYKVIPRDIPETEQYEAAQEIYKQATSNSGYLRGFLQKFFTEAFINRIGLDNIYFFGPHTYENVYSLFQLKLLKAMESVSKEKEGSRSWKIQFKSQTDYKKLLDFMTHHQFHLWEQGASIERAVKEFTDELVSQLLMSRAQSQSEVILSFGEVQEVEDKEHSANHKFTIAMHIDVPTQHLNLQTEISGKTTEKEAKKNATHLLLTAYHEAGHEIVRQVLLGQYEKSEGIKITPGIAEINGQWIRYLGLASSSEKMESIPTLDFIVRRIAVLMGGTMAEELISKNGVSTAGKSNDIQRATQLAQRAILQFGLMPEWGNRAIQDGQDVNAFINSLSTEERKKYETALEKLLNIGKSLAHKSLIANFDNLLQPIGSELAKKGELKGSDLQEFYMKTNIVRIDDHESLKAAMKSYDKKVLSESAPTSIFNGIINKLRGKTMTVSEGEELKIYSFVSKPEEVVNVSALLKQQKEEAHSRVDLSAANQFIRTITPTQASRTCADVLLH